MKIYLIGDIETLMSESDLRILVPASMQEILMEEKVVKRDFLMDTVAGLRMQNPNLTAEEIADKMLLEKELIENILKREEELGDIAHPEPSYKKCNIVCNQMTDNIYGRCVSEKDIWEIGELSDNKSSVRWACKGHTDTSNVLPWKFLKERISNADGLKGDALRAIAGVRENEESFETVVCNPSVFSPEFNCYILTGIKWNSAEKFLSFDNWSVFGLTGESKTDTGLYLKIKEQLHTDSYKFLREEMERVFKKVVSKKALTAVSSDKKLNDICNERGIELSDFLKSKISERQRAIAGRVEDQNVTVAMKLFSTMEWELFEVVNKISKKRRKKIPGLYRSAINKPNFVYDLFREADLQYDEKFFNAYFSEVNDYNLDRILNKHEGEPSFGALFLSMLLYHYDELQNKPESSQRSGYTPVVRLKDTFPDFMIAFDLVNFKRVRNAEKHQSKVTSANIEAMIALCGKLDEVLFGIDFTAELGVFTINTRKKAEVTDGIIEYLGLEKESDIAVLQSLLNNFISEDSQMYNNCEQLIVSVIGEYLSKQAYSVKYSDREQRNGLIAAALKSVGIDVGEGKFNFMKSTLNHALVPQRFCDLIICDGQRADKPFLKTLKQQAWIVSFIDDLVDNKIGHTNALFESQEAKSVLENSEEFIKIITNL